MADENLKDLEAFRAVWKQEVANRPHDKQAASSAPPPHGASQTVAGPLRQNASDASGSAASVASPPTSPRAVRTVTSPTRSKGRVLSPEVKTNLLPEATEGPEQEQAPRSALETYALAVEAESSGRLPLAVKLYSMAFRSDPHVDRAYNKHSTTHPTVSLVSHPPGQFTFRTHVHTGPDVDHSPSLPANSEIDHLALSVSLMGATFLPEDETKSVVLDALPDEILVLVLRTLGQEGNWATLCRFGLVSKKAYRLADETAIWKEICELAFQPPQVPAPIAAETLRREACFRNYRELFVGRRRVRVDGVYISICHYVRSGESDGSNSSWIEPTHLITYHRILRFYHDGTALSILSTEHPSVLVPRISRSLRMKGLTLGRWSFDEDPDRDAHVIKIENLLDPGATELKYEFEMSLDLMSSKRGMWNKLNLRSYISRSFSTDEEIPIRLAHQKPFYFSRVKSYPAY